MNWSPLIAAVIAPLAIHLVGWMFNGPEVVMRQRLLDDIAIRDGLPEGAEKAAYADTVVTDARKLLNLRGVINAQRSCTRMLWVAATGLLLLVVCVAVLPMAMKIPSAIGAAAYLFGVVILVRARGRIVRIRKGIEDLEEASRWIWRHALLLPLRLTEKKVAGLVRSAEDLIQPRVERV